MFQRRAKHAIVRIERELAKLAGELVRLPPATLGESLHNFIIVFLFETKTLHIGRPLVRKLSRSL